MSRNELIALVKENGIETPRAPQTMKTVELEELVKNMGEVKVETRGRRVDPNSARQKRLKALAEKREAGELRRGRPVDENSDRQKRLAELEEKKENGELRKGRPVDPNSARQKRLAELEAKRANGTLRRGRPKNEVVEEEVDASKMELIECEIEKFELNEETGEGELVVRPKTKTEE